MRDHYQCVVCGSPKDLEVHHIKHLTPENINDVQVSLNIANLKTLCRDCHFKEHEAEKLAGYHGSTEKVECADGLMFDENGYLIEKR